MGHPLALDPATVYEYTCHRCGTVTRLGPAGGNLDCNDCGATADEIAVAVEYPDGTRVSWSTMAELVGMT